MKLIGIDWEEKHRKNRIAGISSGTGNLEAGTGSWFGMVNPRLEIPILLASLLAFIPVYA